MENGMRHCIQHDSVWGKQWVMQQRSRLNGWLSWSGKCGKARGYNNLATLTFRSNFIFKGTWFGPHSYSSRHFEDTLASVALYPVMLALGVSFRSRKMSQHGASINTPAQLLSLRRQQNCKIFDHVIHVGGSYVQRRRTNSPFLS